MNTNQSSLTASVLEQVKQEPLGKVIADQFGVTPTALEIPFSKTKKKEIVNARFLFMYYASKVKGKGPSCIGRKVGRGHADIIHAIRQAGNRINTEKDYREKYSHILLQIEQGRVIIPEFCEI